MGKGVRAVGHRRPARGGRHDGLSLASLTKPFAAAVLLQLVEEAKVSLDDPVAMYGINLSSPAGTVIRVRQAFAIGAVPLPAAP